MISAPNMIQQPLQTQRQAFREKRLQHMLRGDEASLTEIVRALRDDSDFSSTVIQMASDAQASESGPIFHLRRAVQLLGFKRVGDLLGKKATAV